MLCINCYRDTLIKPIKDYRSAFGYSITTAAVIKVIFFAAQTLAGSGFQQTAIKIVALVFGELKTRFIFALPKRKETTFFHNREGNKTRNKASDLIGTTATNKEPLKGNKELNKTYSHLFRKISLRQRYSKQTITAQKI